MVKIFGREPALWGALFASLISALGTFVFHFTVDQEGALNGIIVAVIGIVVWRMTHDGSPALILGLVKAAIVAAAAWHFNLPTDKQTILLAFLSSIVAMFVRTQVKAPVSGE
jgi:hypothetical protein